MPPDAIDEAYLIHVDVLGSFDRDTGTEENGYVTTRRKRQLDPDAVYCLKQAS